VIQVQIKVIEVELERILGALKHLSEKPDSIVDAASAALDNESAGELFEKLEPLLRKNCISSLKYLDELRDISGTEELVKQIESYKFKQALDILEDLRS
jgi:hypothetical protein